MSRQHEFPRNISKYNIIEKEGIKLRSPTSRQHEFLRKRERIGKRAIEISFLFLGIMRG